MNFEIFLERAKNCPKQRLAVASPEDESVLDAVLAAEREGLIEAILIGNEEIIRKMTHSEKIVNAQSTEEAAALAVGMIRAGEADILMKGLLDTRTLLRAVVNSETGIREQKLLSHITLFSLPDFPRLLAASDCAMVISPGIEEKRSIIENAALFMRRIGVRNPKIALISATEKTNPKLPSSVEASELTDHFRNEKDFMVALRDLTELNLKALDVVRSIIVRNVEKGLLPNYAKGLIDIKTQYNTIGVIGIYEAIKTFGYVKEDEFGNTFYTDEAFAFAKKLFSVIHTTKDHFALDKDYMINVEAIPGESAAAKMQAADEILYPETVVKDLPLYGNQFIPLGIKTTLHERIRIASAFDEYCNGGSILHVNIEAPFQNKEQAWNMLDYITDQGVTYFAFNTKIQACEYNHAFFGKKCPECGGPVATEYTRIVGFYTPIKTWSKKRKEEYELREWEDFSNEQEVRVG